LTVKGLSKNKIPN